MRKESRPSSRGAVKPASLFIFIFTLTPAAACLGGDREVIASAVSGGTFHTCALTTEGGVMCWGWNNGGQLGDGTTFDSTIPIAVKGLGSGVAAVSAGRLHLPAQIESGGLKCWGLNNGGQLGDGTNGRQVEPVAVSGLQSGVTAVSAGLVHTCAMTSQGDLKCWGVGSSGQLGDGAASGEHSSVPVDVVGFTGR